MPNQPNPNESVETAKSLEVTRTTGSKAAELENKVDLASAASNRSVGFFKPSLADAKESIHKIVATTGTIAQALSMPTPTATTASTPGSSSPGASSGSSSTAG